MIVGSLCTIPIRKESFQQVVHTILDEQTMPIDQLHVWLNGYSQIDSDLPRDIRLIYHLEQSNPGPWIRYKVTDDLDDKSILVTLDDDILYPADYVSQGLSWINKYREKAAICFTGIIWDPFQNHFIYGLRRFHYMVEKRLSDVRRVALNGGGGSFFPAATVRDVINFKSLGFRTNDDMMVSYILQKRKVSILCCPKPAGWIRETDSSRAQHALYLTDSNVRQRTFSELVNGLGFDPTAGMLMEIKKCKNHVLILGDTCPPLPSGELLDQAARQHCDNDSSVHVLAGAPAFVEYQVQQYVDTSYLIHPVTYPEPGGRLDNVSIVHAWRKRRIHRQKQLNWQERYKTITSMLGPMEMYWVGQVTPTWTSEIAGNAHPLFFH